MLILKSIVKFIFGAKYVKFIFGAKYVKFIFGALVACQQLVNIHIMCVCVCVLFHIVYSKYVFDIAISKSMSNLYLVQ